MRLPGSTHVDRNPASPAVCCHLWRQSGPTPAMMPAARLIHAPASGKAPKMMAGATREPFGPARNEDPEQRPARRPGTQIWSAA